MSTKCDNCKKSITKSSLGVECSKCDRVVHITNKCTGLSNKQITALKAAPSLEWTCLDCQAENPRRNSSILIPEEEEDEDEAPVQINQKKLLANISKEVEKALKKEMKELHDSLQFNNVKMEEMIECIDEFKKTIKSLERKNIEITNKYTNLETRVEAMEQRIHELEQESIGTCVEIANVSAVTKEEVQQVISNIALKLEQPKEGIKKVRQLHGKKDEVPKIFVELADTNTQEEWVVAAKDMKLTVADIHPTIKNNHSRIYIREAMTKYNKQLFWNTKQELKINRSFKFVWFKKGVIRARSKENEKVFTIRKLDDLQAIINRS